MKYRGFLFLFVLMFLFTGCFSLFQSKKMFEEANAAHNEGKYNKALYLYEDLIAEYDKREQRAAAKVYYNAGMVAYELNNPIKTIEYLEMARLSEKFDENSLLALANSYKEVDNLSLEIRRLEDYLMNYPERDEISKIKERYFLALAESMSWQQAYDLWPDLKIEKHKDEELTKAYLLVNDALNNDEVAEELARKLLKINNANRAALDWLAKKYYYNALNRYNHETEAYERNRTNRQYAQLLDAWGGIHDDFRTSRDYFEALYKNYPDREYATFLANIYERLNNDEKARYYKRKANE